MQCDIIEDVIHFLSKDNTIYLKGVCVSMIVIHHI